MSLLLLSGVVGGYGRGQVVHGVDVRVDADEVVCLLGPNGAGKTTLLRMVAGVLNLIAGSVALRGNEVQALPAHKRTTAGLAYVPEEPSIFKSMSILENLRLGAVPAGKASDRMWLSEHLEQVFDIFPRLKDRTAQEAGTLSGGEQKMLVIGRALMSDPDILMLDEPSLGLAPKLVVQIFEALEEIQRRRKLAVLIAEQNADRALSWAHRAYVMSEGKIQFEGSSDRLLGDTALMSRLYLGETLDHE